jgi:transposase
VGICVCNSPQGGCFHRNRCSIRPIALNRKNALFAGHDAGAENWATIASLTETCKLNAVDPLAYLTATLAAIVNGHKQSRIDELLPWNYAAK